MQFPLLCFCLEKEVDRVTRERPNSSPAVPFGGSRTISPSRCHMQRQKRHRAPAEFKEAVLAILREAGYEDARSAKLAQEDFLALLARFNAAGIHFR